MLMPNDLATNNDILKIFPNLYKGNDFIKTNHLKWLLNSKQKVQNNNYKLLHNNHKRKRIIIARHKKLPAYR
jgi:hypothetical protein